MVVDRLTPEELSQVAEDPSQLNSIAQTYVDPFHPDPLPLSEAARRELIFNNVLVARILRSRASASSLAPEQAFSDEEFARQAGLAGEELKTLAVGYRFDQREPSAIVEAGGFFPRRDKQPITLLEHSLQGTQGGHYISVTVDPDNEFIVPQAMFKDTPATSPAIHLVKEAFEYEVRDVRGILVGEHGADFEKEFITNAVKLTQIARYRSVLHYRYRRSDGRLGQQTLFGDWQPMSR